ncbi:MAG: hypothetical protein COV74_00760 [Candidatus Omnitrophica bacterium CG11_big_fil_rev_8_21_14_0_20_45_26]|uniref:HTH cro/C1-type domain-containing protein n=1 Tax=Candidatus Abzuiibacterium crystallinum TaxID=1974748 RepID=A0A2H0LSU8_9BACT|nr:MAG: hypothetical protein COV74_00760 [Candidatus Omnitrophica bacterium CG11_big_fil_rev_8_21_14_0_20_45_26]PIW64854.1 MAG: hypothetical protein COW12_04520 [Candidatus Omnitrophica bacterium CG12_big_fil_rev_8_21_14_0_65_45_16]
MNALIEPPIQDFGEPQPDPVSHIGAAMRVLRQRRGQKAVELAKSAGLDPRTYAAIEKGRIKNPSLQNIEAIARALDITPSELFSQHTTQQPDNLFIGTQKGEFTLDYEERGFRIISFTPPHPSFFVGKVLMHQGARLDAGIFPMEGHLFIQIVFGKLALSVNRQEFFLKEGNTLLINSKLPYAFFNPHIRETSFLLTSVPSFIKK